MNKKHKIFRLAFATDLHLNFVSQTGVEAFCDSVIVRKPDALIITGDISYSKTLVEDLKFLNSRIQAVCPVFFVMGNHDFYNGSIIDVRNKISELFSYTEEHKKTLASTIAWLGSSGVVPLTDKIALIGHDGWYDGGYANWFTSTVMLNDYHLIEELTRWGNGKTILYKEINKLAEESTGYIRKHLLEAFKKFEHVFVATHVPPFRENSVNMNKISDDNWMPHFSSKKMGDMLIELCEANSGKQVTVLCGHSHGQADNNILPNLRCITGEARYRHPKVNKVFKL